MTQTAALKAAMITSIIHQILCLGCSPLPISLTTRVVHVSQMALHPVVSRHVYCWGEGQESYVVSQHSGPVNEKAKCYMYNLCKEKGDLCDLCAVGHFMQMRWIRAHFLQIYLWWAASRQTVIFFKFIEKCNWICFGALSELYEMCKIVTCMQKECDNAYMY